MPLVLPASFYQYAALLLVRNANQYSTLLAIIRAGPQQSIRITHPCQK